MVGEACKITQYMVQPTFPSLYRFGLNRTVWLPVVSRLMSGGEFG